MKKLRLLGLSQFLVILILICIMGLNTYNCDMTAYINLYQRICDGYWPGGMEYGFILSLVIASKFGITYNTYVLIVAIVGVLLLHRGIKYFTNKTTMILVLYLFFPFFLDVIQIRNFIVVAILVYATHFLMKFTIKNIVSYVIWIIIAASFHSVAYAYLLFCVLFVQNERIRKGITNILWCISFLIFLFYNQIFELFAKISPNIARYTKYGLSGTSLVTKFLFLFYMIIVAIVFRGIEKSYQNTELSQKQQGHYLIIKMSKLANLFYFIMIFEVDFYRVYRNMLILFYIVWCDYIIKNGKVRVKSFVLVFTFMIVSFIAFIGAYTFDTVVVEVLTNNLVWKWIFS